VVTCVTSWYLSSYTKVPTVPTEKILRTKISTKGQKFRARKPLHYSLTPTIYTAPLIAPPCTLQPVEHFSSSPPPAHSAIEHTRASQAVATPGSMSSRGALHIPTKKRSAGAPFVTRVPCNPETSVGLQAALVEPASAHLHVAKPVRCSARGITLAVTTDRYCTMTSSSFCIGDYSLICKLCDRRMDGRIIYMYM
jgi:hypothetical protein